MYRVRNFLPIIIIGAIILIVALIVSLNLIPSKQQDNSNEYKIVGYNIDVTVLEDNKLIVDETIETNFFVYSHGIFRQIPIYEQVKFVDGENIKTKNYEVEISLLSCSHKLDFYKSNGNYVFQIGDPNKYASSKETYELSYIIDFGDDKITNFDQLYYNFVGNQWDTTISNINISINFVKPVINNKITFYVGTTDGDLAFEEEILNNSVSFSYNGTLEPYYGITGRTVLNEGYFNVEKQGITEDILFLCLSFVILIAGLLIYIFKNNKNKVVEIVEFKAPKGITPSDAGYIVDKSVNKGDIAALLVYWANKGFIKIIEDNEEIKIQKLKDSNKSFKVYEKEIFESLFDGKEITNLKDKNYKLGEAVVKAKDGIKFENEKFFSPIVSALKLLFIFVYSAFIPIMYYFIAKKVAIEFYSIFICCLIGIAIFGACFLLKYVFERKMTLNKVLFYFLIMFSILILLAIYIPSAYFLYESYSNPLMVTIFVPIILFGLVLFSINLNNRVESNDKIIGRVFGLRNFILYAEKDRLKMLVEENPSLFYEILPYAYVLGISNKWIKKFDEIEVQSPNWYQGIQTFSGIYISTRILLSMQAFNTLSKISIRPKLNSGGKFGGFGGGGFGGGSFGGGFGGGASGRGLGGGGGGRW